MNFAQFLEFSTQKFPEKVALVAGERRLTYRQMEARSQKMANTLYAMGFRAGDRVALAASNCLEYPEIIFGCARLGVAAVMLNWRLSTEELVKLLERNRAQAVITRLTNEEKDLELYHAVGDRMSVFCLREIPGTISYQALLEGDHPAIPMAHLPEDHILLHIHTSGTTGIPKSVLYTHGSFAKSVLTYLYHHSVTPDAVTQQITQMFHSACIGMFGSLAVGATTISLNRFRIEEYLETIQREGTTRLALIPSILRNIVTYPHLDRYDLSTVRDIAYSTAPMPPKLIRQAMTLFHCNYYTTYGMTEMGPIVTALSPREHDEAHLASVGRPIIGADVRIVDADGVECPVGIPGKVTVRGFSMMKEYLDMPEETAAAIRDGWFHTGDMGYLDADGYLYLKGRKNDMIITGGENVYPAEIENVFSLHCEDVVECVAYGVPDEAWGEIVVASVVLVPGSTQTPESLRELCYEKLANYQVPKHIFIEESLPRNQTGKVMPRILVDRYISDMKAETVAE